MTVKNFADKLGFECLCMPEPDREVGGAYIGDLLSWVMGRADADCVWITIMSNLNIVAVATLSDVSCILLAEGVSLDSEVCRTAEEKGVNVLKTDLPAYEAAVKISEVLC
jgi:hypothetical protein